jgi:hypothetical protein
MQGPYSATTRPIPWHLVKLQVQKLAHYSLITQSSWHHTCGINAKSGEATTKNCCLIDAYIHPQAFTTPDASRFQVKKVTRNVLHDSHQPNYIAKLKIPPKLVTKNSTTTLFTCQSFIISEVISSSKNSHLKTPRTWIELHYHIYKVTCCVRASRSWSPVSVYRGPETQCPFSACIRDCQSCVRLSVTVSRESQISITTFCDRQTWEPNIEVLKPRSWEPGLKSQMQQHGSNRRRVTRSQVPCKPTWGSKYATMRKELELGAAL